MKPLLTILLLLFCAATQAGIYKWTDKHGVVHYGDKPPDAAQEVPVGKVEAVELTPITILDDGTVRNNGQEDDSWMGKALAMVDDFKQAALKQINEWRGTTPVVTNTAKVDIYTTAWCKACKAAKQWLANRGVQYTEYDIQQDPNAALRMRKLGGGGGVPFAVINGKTVQGFSPSDYQAALR